MRPVCSVGTVQHLTPEGVSLPPARAARVDNSATALALAPVPLGAHHEQASLARSIQRYSDDVEAGVEPGIATSPPGDSAIVGLHAVPTGLMRTEISSLGRVWARVFSWLGDWG